MQRIWIFSKHPVCNGFKYNSLAPAAFRGAW